MDFFKFLIDFGIMYIWGKIQVGIFKDKKIERRFVILFIVGEIEFVIWFN